MKYLITPSEIEPGTFRFVAQCLNQLHYRVTTINDEHNEQRASKIWRMSANWRSEFSAPLLYVVIKNVITPYLLHGAESFLRS